MVLLTVPPRAEAVLPVLVDALAGGPVITVGQAPDGDDPLDAEAAVVVSTSGSTGEPKFALLSARALRASAGSTLDYLGGPGQWLLALPLTHIAGLQVLVRSVIAGVDPVTMDLSGGFTPAAFAAAVSTMDNSRTYVSLVPTQLGRILDAGGAAMEALLRFDAVLVGGAALSPALRRRVELSGVRAVRTYGMSETCGGCVYDGVPLSGVDIDLDDEGRILIGGPMLFSGYRGRPDLTAASMVDGRFRTADIGQWADGRLHVLGRIDDIIISGGEKIAPTAVEAVLSEHPSVSEAAVVGVPDDEWGQRVVAVVVPAGFVAVGELRDHVGAVLGRRAAPSAVVTVDSLPRLPLGKVDRRAVIRLAQAAI